MSADIDIPTSYTFTLGGAVDFDLDNIRVKELAPINLNTNGTLNLGLNDIRIKELPKIHLETDNSLEIRVKELPRIDLHLELAMKPTRVHFPVNMKLGLCAMGLELFALCLCGEGMVVVEDYRPHATEACT